MEIHDETTRLFVYGIVFLIAAIVAVQIFPLTLSALALFTMSPIGLFCSLVGFVATVLIYTGVITMVLIEPSPSSSKNEESKSNQSLEVNRGNKEIIEGISLESEPVIHLELNDDPIDIESTIVNTSNNSVTALYELKFVASDGSIYASTPAKAINIAPHSKHTFTTSSPRVVTGNTFSNNHLSVIGRIIDAWN